MFVCVCVSVYTLVWPKRSNEDCLYECDWRIINWSIVGPPKKMTPSPGTSGRKIYSLLFLKDPGLLLISLKGPKWLQQQISPPCENTILFLFLKHLQTSALIYLNKYNSLIAHWQCPWKFLCISSVSSRVLWSWWTVVNTCLSTIAPRCKRNANICWNRGSFFRL